MAALRKRSLAPRGLSPWGGYGLQANPCPELTSSCGDSCCPNGYSCASAGNHKDGTSLIEAICCPTDADCSSTVRIVKACADNSWGLYHAFGEFCCPSDQIGIYPRQGVWCMPKSLPVPSDILAGSAVQATATKTVLATGGRSGTSSPTAGTISGDSNSESPSSNANNVSSKSGLPQGAVIAIAVLAAIIGMLLIFIIWYFWRRKRNANGPILSTSQPPTAEPVKGVSPAPVQAVNPDTNHIPTKTPAPLVNELPGRNALHPVGVPELSTTPRAELDTNSRVS